MTRHFAKLSISPESSDGFASVGTILPKEEATLLPGGFFAFSGYNFWVIVGKNFPKRKPNEKKSTSMFTSIMKTGTMPPMQGV